MTEAVKAVVTSRTIQKVITRLGFNSLDYIAPLGALITVPRDRSETYNPNKWVAYPHVSGIPGDSSSLPDIINRKLVELSQELWREFPAHHVEPNDLHSEQLLYDPDTREVHLIDTESYAR
jgi:hypothetical protein